MLALAAASAFGCGAVRVSEFGYDPADSTRFLQAALDSGARTVVLDRRAGPWVTLPLLVRSNTEVVVEPGVELVAKRGEFRGVRDYLFTLHGVTNVTLRGGEGSTFRMWKADYQKPPYERSEWRYTLRIVRSANVVVENMRFEESGGDGIVVGGNSRNVTIRNCVCDRNHRQGLSICSGENVLVENCVFSNTSGTAPEAGVDFEPDLPDEKLVNCMLRNCLSVGNAGDGYDVVPHQLRARSAPVSVTLENCTATSNRHSVLICTNRRGHEDFPGGLIRIKGCSFRDSRGAGVQIRQMPLGGPRMVFEDCVVSNSGCGKAPDLAFCADSWNGDHCDGIEFRNLVIHRKYVDGWLKPPRPTFGNVAREISGDVRFVLADGGEKRIALDDAWRVANFRAYDGERPFPQVSEDAVRDWRIEVHDSAPGEMSELSEVFAHVAADYAFYAEGERDVRFVARTGERRKGATPARHVEVFGADGVSRLALLPMPGATNELLTFHAPAAGVYRVRVDGWGAPFTMAASDTPVAFTPFRGRERLLAFPPKEGPQTVSLWIAADRPFSYVNPGTTTDWGLVGRLCDPDGACAADLGNLHDLKVANMRPAGKGLWRMDYCRRSVDAMSVAAFDVTGVPGFLFLSNRKFWFSKKKGL